MSPPSSDLFRMPDVAAPFVTVQKISNQVGMLQRNRPHYHPDTVEICAIIRGQLDWLMADHNYLVKTGDILIVPAMTVHGSADTVLQPCELVVLHVAPEMLSGKVGEAFQQVGVKRIRYPEIQDQLIKILGVHQEQGSFFEEQIMALGTLLAVSVVEAEPSEDEAEVSRVIRFAQRELLAHQNRPTIEGISQRLGVSAVWLHQLFVRETGSTPGDWARAKRIAVAKARLVEGDATHEQIALELGYSSGQSFATAFRKESGMTPSAYRQRQREVGEVEQRVYEVKMRETWVDGVRVYPPGE